MLSRLTITNYALISRLELEPGIGLSIITGETGAGKSVMMGALGLIKGERADLKVISDKDKKATVEAVFTNLDDELVNKIKELDPEWNDGELILRREILPSGRSRAFVNDSPVTLQQLQEVSRGLLDIHSQNSNSLLSEQKMQLSLIDSVAGHSSALAEYEDLFRQYVALRQRIKLAKEEESKKRQQADIIAFRFGQLDKLRPKSGELKRIETRYEALSNSEEIREKLSGARNALASEGRGALESLENASSLLSGIDLSAWIEDSDIPARLRQCIIEVKDIAETVGGVLEDVEYDPSALDSLSSRMQAYYAAMKAFRVTDDQQLVQLYEEVKREYESLENGDMDTELLEKEARGKAIALKELAASISEGRRRAAGSLQSEIESEARRLGLENLDFRIEISASKLSRTGGDAVAFLAAFNKNQVPVPVGEMASGGEMARLMLAVKKITSGRLALPTVVFDEIDTGVSGHIADRMGEMMKEMGRDMQIITITHLPQVAAKGNRHFKVYKEDREDRTVTDVLLLSSEEREYEIARMLSGEEINEAAVDNARSLLK